MKKTVFLFALSLGLKLFGQVDYFDYNETVVPTSTTTPVSTNNVAVPLVKDENNNIYYIDNFKGTGTGKIHLLQPGSPNWINTTLTSTVRANAANGLLYAGWKIFYVASDNTIRNFYKVNGVWTDAPLGVAQTVLAGTNLTAAPNGDLYFVASDEKLYRLYWTTGIGWQTQLLYFPYGYPQLCKANQKILFSVDRIFYVGKTDGKIYNALKSTGGNWLGGPAISNSIVAANSSLYSDAASKLFFVGYADKSIHNLVWTGVWNDWVVHPDAPKVHPYNANFTVKGNEIYYVSSPNFSPGYNFINWGPQVHCLYWDECYWKWTDLKKDNNDVKDNATLLFDSNNKLFYGNVNNTISYLVPPINESNHNYIYVKGKKLMDHGNPFEVKCVNYIAEVYSTNNTPSFNSGETLYIGPCEHYQTKARIDSGLKTSTGVADGIAKVRADFAKIKSEGFNTVRLMGNFLAGLKDANICINQNSLAGGYTQVSDSADTKIYFHKSVPTTSGSCTQWYTDIEYNATSKAKLFAVLDDLVYCAEQENIKLILTTGFMNGDNPAAFSNYSNYLAEVADHLKNKPAILAYDYWNEPNILAHLVNNNDKAVFCDATKSWYNSIRANSPSQLVTVGLYHTFDFLHNWDPTVLSTDFVGFHPYAWRTYGENISEPQKRWDNSIYFISSIMQKVDKPWIIEETSFLAGDDVNDASSHDWGTEQDQENFALHMMNRTKNCGAAGWAWWQYRDVFWDLDQINSPGENFLGLIDHNGNDKLLINDSSLGLVGNSIFNSAISQTCNCSASTDYYNETNNSGWVISGTVTGGGLLPIDVGLVSGSGNNPPGTFNDHSYTFIKPDGTFTITSNNRIVHSLTISAPGFYTQTIPWQTLATCGGGNCNNWDIGTISLNPVNCNESMYRIKNNEQLPIAQSIEIADVNCYPNPTTGIITVNANALINSYSVYDMQGVLLEKKDNVAQSMIDVDLKGRASGVYYIRVNTNGKIITKKIVLL